MFSWFSVSLGIPIILSLVFLYLQSVLIPSRTAGQVIVVVCVWSCLTFPGVQEKKPKGYSLVHFLGLLTQNKGSHKQHHCSNLVLKVQGIFLKSCPNSLWPTGCVSTYTSAGTHSAVPGPRAAGTCSPCRAALTPHCRRVQLCSSHPRAPTQGLLSSLTHVFSIPPLFSSHHHQRAFSMLCWVCSQMIRREICWCLSRVLCLFSSKCF